MTWLDDAEYTLPDPFPFHQPKISEDGSGCYEVYTVKLMLSSDENSKYRQLINWWMIERYWIYVIGRPQSTFEEMDRVYREIVDMEEKCADSLTVHCRLQQWPLGCSPTKAEFNWIWSRYPQHIQDMFRGVPIDPKPPWILGTGNYKGQKAAVKLPDPPKPRPKYRKHDNASK